MTASIARPISEARADFIRTLLTERAVPAAAASRLLDGLDAGTVDSRAATDAIDWLKRQPRAAAAAAPTGLPAADVVPAGRYAIPTGDTAANRLAFYRVDRPTEGRWAGFVFVKLIVSDDEQRLSRAAAATILARIAEIGAAAASAAYGTEIGACGVCGRTLTNDASRAAGIGPICAAANGW